MQRNYWPEWKYFLSQRGLNPLAYNLLLKARALFPLAAQVMVLGLPVFKGYSSSSQFAALLDTLGDEDNIQQFADYLQEVSA